MKILHSLRCYLGGESSSIYARCAAGKKKFGGGETKGDEIRVNGIEASSDTK